MLPFLRAAWPPAVTLLVLVVASATCARGQARVWRELEPTTLGECQLVYDEGRDRFVAVVGRRTLEWDGASWQARSTAQAPPLRLGYRLAYDNVRHRTVYFGGHRQTHGFGSGAAHDEDVWEFDGIDWERISPPPGPRGRFDHAMAFDEGRGRVVVWGGVDDLVALGDSWEWDGTRWRAIPGGPSALLAPAMAWFRGPGSPGPQGHLVAVGRRAGTTTTETWTYGPGGWRQQSPSVQPANGTMASDRAGRRVLLRATGRPLLAWTGTDWLAVAETGAPPDVTGRYGFAADTTGTTLAVGGMRPIAVPGSPLMSAGASGDTWALVGGQWTTLQRFGPSSIADADLDPTRGVVLGLDTSSVARTQLWAWDGRAWAERAGQTTQPPATYSAAFRVDPVRGVGVLFGGLALTGLFPAPVDSVWEWGGTDWMLRQPLAGPTARTNHAMVFDGGRNLMLVFGGVGTAGISDEAWTWNGVAWARPPGPTPPARSEAAMAYDPVRDRVVLFGGNATGPPAMTALGDTWEWDGASWRQVGSATAPAPRCNHTMAFDPVSARVVLTGGFVRHAAGGLEASPEEWSWDGARWQLESRALPRSLVGLDSLMRHPTAPGLVAVRHVEGNAFQTVSLWLGATTAADVQTVGTGCGTPAPVLAALGAPVLGNGRFALDVAGAPPHAMTVLGLEPNFANLPVSARCSILVRPAVHSNLQRTNSVGAATFSLPVPNLPALIGADLFGQAGILDASSAPGFALTHAVRLRVGI